MFTLSSRPVLYFRDDDVGGCSQNLSRLLGIFAVQGAPLNLEVVPGRLTPACEKLLRKHCRRGDRLEVHQHGFLHKNHSPAPAASCEYGDNRDRAVVSQELSCGRRILREAFGDSFFGAFSPPWNRISDRHIPCLADAGFKVLSRSAGKRPVFFEGRLWEIDVTLDIFDWKKKRPIPRQAFLEKLVSQLKSGVCGIVLHHERMDDASFALLEGLLRKISKTPFRIYTFKEIYQAARREAGG